LSGYALISEETPLISNLNILENIALIKEIHEHMPTRKAQTLAQEYLNKIGHEKIGQLRINSCNNAEIFDVMLVRAMMSKEDTVVILPLSSMDNLKEMQEMLKHIKELSEEKKIVILDIIENEVYYKGCGSCNIVK